MPIFGGSGISLNRYGMGGHERFQRSTAALVSSRGSMDRKCLSYIANVVGGFH